LDFVFRRGKGDKDVKKPVKKTIAAFLDFYDLIILELALLKLQILASENRKNIF
jgi:hypothetical protein